MGRRKSKRQLDDPDRHASSRGRSLDGRLPLKLALLEDRMVLSLSLARALSLFGKTHGHSARPSRRSRSRALFVSER